jgi:hypothetical protein
MLNYRACVHVFCPACQGLIVLNNVDQGSCENPKCAERTNMIQVSLRVVRIAPVEDSFYRPARAPLVARLRKT